MSVELGKMTFRVEQQKKVCDDKSAYFPTYTMVPRSPEELFLLTQLAPATHSSNVSNRYFLNANIKYDGCTCNATLPNVSIPMTILPKTFDYSQGLQEPAGFAPVSLGQFRFEIPN